MNDNLIEFKPSIGRYAFSRMLIYVSPYVLLATIWLARGTFTLGNWLLGFVIALVVAGILSLISVGVVRATAIIVISDDEINGPSPQGRVVIPLRKIDIAKSRKRSALQYLVEKYEIQSTDGKKIAVNGAAFSKDQFNRMLETISAMQRSGTVS